MIRVLTGEVLSVTETSAIIDANGLGFEVICTRGALDLCRVGERARITTYLQVSEAGVFIYGFASEREREVFLRIISIKGVGGKTAMAMLSALPAEEILRAASAGDVTSFVRVPGIGKKTAERLCFELKGLLAGLDIEKGGIPDAGSSPQAVQTVIDALLSLGFSQSDAGTVLAKIRSAQGGDVGGLDEEALLKLALRELHRR